MLAGRKQPSSIAGKTGRHGLSWGIVIVQNSNLFEWLMVGWNCSGSVTLNEFWKALVAQGFALGIHCPLPEEQFPELINNIKVQCWKICRDCGFVPKELQIHLFSRLFPTTYLRPNMLWCIWGCLPEPHNFSWAFLSTGHGFQLRMISCNWTLMPWGIMWTRPH